MASFNLEKNCIFFHIPKNAGSYIQHTLNKSYNFIGNNYWAKRYDTDELILHSNFLKNNFHKDTKYLNSLMPYSTKKIGIQKYFSTSPLLLKLMNLNEEKWNNLYKFTFVRNPYDRFISGWNFILKKINKPILLDDEKYSLEDVEKFNDLEYTIQNKDMFTPISYNHIFVTQYEHVLDKNGKNNMDFIGKMENLEPDLENVLQKLGFTEITHTKDKKINETKHNYYKEYYNQTILDFVNKWFEKDFLEFGYERFDTMEEFTKSSNV